MKKKITLLEALLPLLAMLLCLVLGSFFFSMNVEFLIVVMLVAATVAGVSAKRLGHDWQAIQASTGDKLAAVLPALLILLSIGMLIGTWMFSGTIPVLVYYGVQLISPDYVLLTAFLATAAMSLTGSSWASAGTIGVALMGVATSMNAPLAATAGAVVSGAYFGDKLSPLSDSTNICAIGANADLYDHIRNMLYTALPSFVFAVLVYLSASVFAGSATGGAVREGFGLLQELEQVYVLGWPTVLPILVVLYGTFRRKPAALTMVFSSVVAMAVGILQHNFTLSSALVAAISGFSLSLLPVDVLAAPSDTLAALLNRGGVNSMASTLVLVICAFLLAGAMDVSGALNTLLARLLQLSRSVFALIAATMASGATLISLTSHGGVSALIIGNLFQEAYREKGLAPENLSRSMEDSITILEPLMPWTVSALFMATTLGVPTLEYAPWAIFCFSGPVFSLLLAAGYEKTGFGLGRRKDSVA